MSKTMVHNHSPEEGRGLDCPEYICGFWAVNKKHCYINNHCIVCRKEEDGTN